MAEQPLIVIQPEEVSDPLRIVIPPSGGPQGDSEVTSANQGVNRVLWWWLVVATFLPGVNAWVWWRWPASSVTGRRLCRAAAVVSCLVSLLFVFGMAALLVLPQRDWIEQAALEAERSVVWIAFDDSIGTGVVVSSRGDQHLVLTNKHVVAGHTGELTVGSRATGMGPANVVGVAKEDDLDLALLLVEAHGLRPLGRIATFDEIRVGQRVVAIGHPYGLDYSITEGIISAKRFGTQLQTSAAINPGNSGGPLINQERAIVGVNTSRREGDGLGFATRADLVFDKTVWDFSHDVTELLREIGK